MKPLPDGFIATDLHEADDRINDLKERCRHYEAVNAEKGALLNTVIRQRDELLAARAICPNCSLLIDEAAGVDVAAKNRRVAELEQQRDELQKDAERYRWLRTEYDERLHTLMICDPFDDSVFLMAGQELDAAIDAAIAKVKT